MQRYSQIFHVPCSDAQALPCFAFIDRVQWGCTELFHAFSLGCCYGSIIHATERLIHTTVQGSYLFTVQGSYLFTFMGLETCEQ